MNLQEFRERIHKRIEKLQKKELQKKWDYETMLRIIESRKTLQTVEMWLEEVK